MRSTPEDADPSASRSSITASDYSVNGVVATTVAPAVLPKSATVTITVPVAVGASSPVTVVASNTTNPAAGTYNMAVNTSKDTVPATTNSYTIAGTAGTSLTSPTVSLSSLVAGANSTYTTTAFTSSSGALLAGTDKVTLTATPGTVYSGSN